MGDLVRRGGRVPQEPAASVIIPVLDRIDHLIPCLRSLASLEARNHEVVVVANGTSDANLDRLPDLESLVVVRSPVNLGFGGGCNWGARVARGRYLVVLNDDTEAEPGWLEALIAVAESDAVIGAVGSRLLDPDGTLQEAGSILWRDAGTHQVGRGLPPASVAYDEVRDVDYCSGCGLLVKREAWDVTGGFDETFFPAYFEDVDLCLSLRSRGYRVVYAPHARLRHFHGGSLSDDERSPIALRNGRRFIAKWAGELSDYDPQPKTRARAEAVAAAIARAARREVPPRALAAGVSQPNKPLTEIEALQIHARAIAAALALDDELIARLCQDQVSLDRLRRAVRRVPLASRFLRWAARHPVAP